LGFCSYCGKELPPQATFCPACGKPVPGATVGPAIGQNQAMPSGVRPNLASEGDRIVAVILDALLIFVISLVIIIPLAFIAGFFGAFSIPFLFFGLLIFIEWLFWLLYFTYFESTTGQTPGKHVMHIRVVDETTLQHLDFGRSLLRNILRIIDYLPVFYLIGFILIATNEKKQRLGDMAARSVVVRE
jgi:uncharacterized RDD family membrane protein YckC